MGEIFAHIKNMSYICIAQLKKNNTAMIDLGNALKHNIDEATAILSNVKDKQIDFTKCDDTFKPWVLVTDADGNIYDALVHQCFISKYGSIEIIVSYAWDSANKLEYSLLDCLSTSANDVCECIAKYDKMQAK